MESQQKLPLCKLTRSRNWQDNTSWEQNNKYTIQKAELHVKAADLGDQPILSHDVRVHSLEHSVTSHLTHNK